MPQIDASRRLGLNEPRGVLNLAQGAKMLRKDPENCANQVFPGGGNLILAHLPGCEFLLMSGYQIFL